MSLCRQYRCLPSQLLKEDSSFLRLIMIENLGTKQKKEDSYDGE